MPDISIGVVQGLLWATLSVSILALSGKFLSNILTPRWQVFFWFAVLVRGVFAVTFNPWGRAISNVEQNVRHVTVRFGNSVSAITEGASWWQSVASRLPSWEVMMVAVWLLGVLLFLVLFALQNVRYVRWVARDREIVDGALLDEVRSIAAAMNISPWIRVFETQAVSSPAVFGLLRFRLLFPVGLVREFDPFERRHVIAHELMHIKKSDALLSLFAHLGLVVQWFNPLVWMAYREFRLAQERRCDFEVCAFLGNAERASYAKTLVRLLENFGFKEAVPGVVLFAESPFEVRRRLLMIFDYASRSHGARLFGGFVSTALLLAGGATAVAGVSSELGAPVPPAPPAPPAAAPSDPFHISTQRFFDSVQNSSGRVLTTKLDFRVERSVSEGKSHVERTAQTVTSSKSGDALVIGGLFSEGDDPSTIRITPSSPYNGNENLVLVKVEIFDRKNDLLAAPSMVVKFGEMASFVEKISLKSGVETTLSLGVTVTPE